LVELFASDNYLRSLLARRRTRQPKRPM